MSDPVYKVSSIAIELRNVERSEGFKLLCEEYEKNKKRVLERMLSEKTEDVESLKLRTAFNLLDSEDFDPAKIIRRLFTRETKK